MKNAVLSSVCTFSMAVVRFRCASDTVGHKLLQTNYSCVLPRDPTFDKVIITRGFGMRKKLLSSRLTASFSNYHHPSGFSFGVTKR